mmetsp:Transcript_19283/g.49007  ORF Transcript_19283/g.49007 Transcript_19283/m.49007 type:complete len:220 (-) Transcript_19283:64-723(-)|eukprot:CAMPEP_0177640998 /NCGR_PEP_ID=MMETSP0447-20121125/6839_1 /TAXON_ID=0 /ORGANISM="Stygamoeba regulata, Strain BSH-02190019" /LENGTH=219 /DNA_ID=CAMNT_0019143101 /DNA_START=116 /DNA_END=775 /DNA_ORIENTATION=+
MQTTASFRQLRARDPSSPANGRRDDDLFRLAHTIQCPRPWLGFFGRPTTIIAEWPQIRPTELSEHCTESQWKNTANAYNRALQWEAENVPRYNTILWTGLALAVAGQLVLAIILIIASMSSFADISATVSLSLYLTAVGGVAILLIGSIVFLVGLRKRSPLYNQSLDQLREAKSQLSEDSSILVLDDMQRAKFYVLESVENESCESVLETTSELDLVVV